MIKRITLAVLLLVLIGLCGAWYQGNPYLPSATLPNVPGSVPVVQSCGATGTGNQTCAPAAANGAAHVVVGSSTLASNAAVITFATAFTSTTSYFCVGNDITTRANPVQMLSTSAGTATITNTTGASDVIQWVCVGQ